MSNKVIATIDISRPSGRKIQRELQNKSVVKLEYPKPTFRIRFVLSRNISYSMQM
jgi:hypothetical protein